MMIADNDATLAEAVRKHIILTLASCAGNRTHAAKILDISIRGLRDKLREYINAGIPVTEARRPKSDATGKIGIVLSARSRRQPVPDYF
jgi:hypothetical protein